MNTRAKTKTLSARVAELEAAVAELRDHVAAADSSTAVSSADSAPSSSQAPPGTTPLDLWALEQLHRRHPDGAVVVAGQLTVPSGPVEWQIALHTPTLIDSDWETASAPLAALGHPVRLRLIQLILTGHETTTQLLADSEVATTGQLHHHLRSLLSTGWIISAGRGRYRVPAAKVVPLLAMITALTQP